MRYISAVFAIMIPLTATAAEAPRSDLRPFKVALLCFSKGEQVSGMNKICYYDCAGSTVAINVKSFELCPLNLNR